MIFKYIYLNDGFTREILRVLVFLLIFTFYLTSIVGIIIAGIHLILAVSNPKKYGMSRILIKILPGK